MGISTRLPVRMASARCCYRSCDPSFSFVGSILFYSLQDGHGGSKIQSHWLFGPALTVGVLRVVSILFVTYLASELPSNLVLKRFRPSRWLAFLATSWGVIATLTGITQNYAGLLVCRLLLGLVEGGLFPSSTRSAVRFKRHADYLEGGLPST